MLFILTCSGIVALAMAWAIGAQDVSNALGTAVGSRAITVRQAIIIGAVCEFSGSLLGSSVATTISKGIVLPNLVANTMLYVEIMFCTLTGAFVWLAIATFLCLPVSTSHSLVGSLVGLAIFVAPQALDASVLLMVCFSWISSPLIGGVVAYIVFSLISRLILKSARPLRSATIVIPYFWGSTCAVLTMFLLVAGPEIMRLHSTVHAVFVGALVFTVTTFSSRRLTHRRLGIAVTSANTGISIDSDTLKEHKSDSKLPVDSADKAESMFVSLMIVTACVVSFAHGSNDVSNSIGPFAAIYEVYTQGNAEGSMPVPLFILVAGGFGIVLGLATYGYKVMATIGERITRLTFSRGFAAQIATALTVLGASLIGLSVSTTHCLIGAIAGLALVEGSDKINKKTLRKIVVSWIVTLPASAFFSLISYALLRLFSSATAAPDDS